MRDGSYSISVTASERLMAKESLALASVITTIDRGHPEKLQGYCLVEVVNRDLSYLHLDAHYGIFGNRSSEEIKLIDSDVFDVRLLRII